MTQKPKRKRKHRLPNKQIVIGLAIFLGLIFASSFLLVLWLGIQFTDTSLSYESDEAKTQIANYLVPLPETAQDVYVWLDIWIDSRGKMRFSLPSDDAELWLASNDWSCEEFTSVGEISTSISYYNDPDWWRFDEVEHSIRGNCSSNNDWFYYIITIDQTQDNIWTFYIDMTSTN